MPIAPIAGSWQRFLVKAGLEISGAVAAYLLAGLTEGTDQKTVDEVAWTRWTIEYSRTTPVGTNEDRAQWSIDIMNLTSGAIDPTWTTTDTNDVIGYLSTCCNSLRTYQQPSHSYVRIRAHLMRFSPTTWPVKRFADTGAPIYSYDYTGAVGLGTAGAYQVAATVTERTAFPSHWGRCYIPGLSGSALDANGRITATARAGILSAYETMVDGLRTKDMYVVVPVTQHNKQPAFGLLSVRELAVDDIPDVQRRRRPKQVGARSVST